MDSKHWLSYLKTLYPVEFKTRVDSHLLCLGIPYQVLKDTSKKIYASDYQSFLQTNPHEVYEMDVIQTKVIGLIKDVEDALTYFKAFIPYAKEWSLVDSLCQNFKIAKKHPEKIFEVLETLSKSTDPFEQRIAAVMILCHFNDEIYVERSIRLLLRLHVDHYYTKMAVAWAFQVLTVSSSERVIAVFNTKTLSPWIQNKAIQKIQESFRISETLKMSFKSLRIK
jgi:3-methyladenine DNA glycosylase AlkD